MRTVYNDPSTPQREESHFASFFALAAHLPIGKWERMPRPDILVTTDERKIGIEHTSAIDEGISPIRSAQEKAFRLAEDKAVKNVWEPLEVKATFRDDRKMIDATEASEELFEIVEANSDPLKESKLNRLNCVGSKYFSQVFVAPGTSRGTKWLKQHRWGRARIHFARSNAVEVIKASIEKKERKLGNYLELCDECWLLIAVDEWNVPESIWLTKECFTHTYITGFSRVYFLRNISQKLLRLKVAKK